MKFTSGLSLTINNDLITIIFGLLSCAYFMILILVCCGLTRLKTQTGRKDYSVSIIIAARNEEKRIRPCLDSLEKLQYPRNKYEVILVDDHSDDNTALIIESYLDKNPNWKHLRLNEKSKKLRGKKNALLHGINESSGEIIFSTDADCIVPPNWLSKMAGYFQDDISMVIGYSPLIYSNRFYFKFLQFDNLFSAIVAAAPAKLGYPFASAGRNIAYRRETYKSVGGFLSLKKYKSGDDIHLTTRFRKKKKGKIDYCADKETFVPTQIPDKIKELFQQQIRKNSKTFQLSVTSILMMTGIFLFYILLVIYPLLKADYLVFWLALVACKFIIEWLVLLKAAIVFDQRNLIPYLLFMQFIYPLHIIIFSVVGSFQYYHWKR